MADTLTLSSHFPEDLDIRSLSLRARWAYVEIMCFSARNNTGGRWRADGKLPAYMRELVDAGKLVEIAHPLYDLKGWSKWNGEAAAQRRNPARSGASEAAAQRRDAAQIVPRSRHNADVLGLYTPSFVEFWKSYPLHKDKRKAANAYAAALSRGADPDAILAGAKRYATDCAGKEAQFVKYAEGWLNWDRWEDESPKVIQRGAAQQAKRSRRLDQMTAEELAELERSVADG